MPSHAGARAAPRTPVPADPRRSAIREALAATRARTLSLVAPLSPDALARQHDRLMSPIVWDLGHIAAFEELWLVSNLGSAAGETALEETFDAFRTPRAKRGGLALPDAGALLERLAAVRRRALERLEGVDLDSANPLLRDGFAYELVREHEAQHQETIAQTILLMRSEPYVPLERRATPGAAPGAPSPGAWVRIPAGAFRLGAPGDGRFAYDNERPAHEARTAAYEIGAHPVTNREYAEFMAAGGYLDRSVWTEAGWKWKEEAGLFAPLYWRPAGVAGGADPSPAEAAARAREEGLAGWRRETSLGREAIPADHPLIHVCAHEADAYARFRGARLLTEVEWEKAAAWDPSTGESRRWPWGDDREPSAQLANSGLAAFGTASVGAYPEGRSAAGCWGMLGDVWEWTSSRFDGYPGFRAFPYDEYSLVFFGDEYRVLRGSSWATAECATRCTFRNWDYPIRRQILAGLRLARDVG